MQESGRDQAVLAIGEALPLQSGRQAMHDLGYYWAFCSIPFHICVSYWGSFVRKTVPMHYNGSLGYTEVSSPPRTDLALCR